MFSNLPEIKFKSWVICILSFACTSTLNLDQSKILLFCKELTLYQRAVFLEGAKFNAFANSRLNVNKMKISVLDMVENIAGKEENADYQQTLLFPQCFQKSSLPGLLKVNTVSYRVNLTLYQTTNSTLFQTTRICRWPFLNLMKMVERKHCGKRRNCSLQAISSFPTVFSKICMADTWKPGLVWKRVNTI